MANDSSTGGPLAPNPPPQPTPLSGAALYAFLQAWLVPLIGLPGNLVYVYDQAEPPSAPDAGQAWAAVKVTIGPYDTFPFVGHDFTPGLEADTLIRHEQLNLLASFYDLGSLGLAQDYCLTLRDALAISQNFEPLILSGMALVGCDDIVTVPTLLQQRWNYRVDLPFRMRHQVTRTYPVRDLVAAEVTVNTDGGLPPQKANTPPLPPQLDFSQPGNSQYVPNP